MEFPHVKDAAFGEREGSLVSTCCSQFEDALQESSKAFDPDVPAAWPKVVVDDGIPSIDLDFRSFDRDCFPLIEPGRFSLEHILRPSDEGQHAQIEVLVDHAASDTKVVAKRFPREYLQHSPEVFQQTKPEEQLENPWTELFLALKLGQGPARMRGVVPCWGVYRDSRDDVLLMLEWSPGGDLFELASDLGEVGPEREATAAQVLYSLLNVVTQLHALGIAHGDVSAENAILRVSGGEVEVALLDFAMALHDTDLSNATGARGKLMYRAPETLGEHAVYDARAADLFACGVVGYVLATGTYPWQSTAGDCKAYSYVRQHGMKRFLDKRFIGSHEQSFEYGQDRIIDDQRAQHHAPPLPCSAAAAFATPGTMPAGMLPASATARALPLLPAFSASAAPAASAPTPLPTDLSACPLSLRGDPEGARALFGSGPDGRGPPISDPASFRPPRPDSYGPVAGRGGALLPDEPMSEHPGAPHDSVATITAAGHGGAAPAIDNGGWHTGPCAVRALVDEAIGSEASARIATDILAIAQGVTNTQADLDRLRNGVSDITEALESKIRDMWELLQAELRKERELFMQFQDSFRERRISDHETLEDHFAKLTSTINDRLIEFDERIHQFNEKRAGSLSMQLAETIRHIKQYPDALRQIQINISNAEARVAAVEQNATHRIEVIRSEMSRALYDHKESNRAHIDQLTARIQHLENAHVRRGGSDRSTPSRPERTQFFDISDHGGDIPRPADLPPVPGALFPGGPTTAIPRSSLLGPIDHGSPPGCNAAPAEKASTVHSQTSGINLDEILRRAQQRVADEQTAESRGQNNPVEPIRHNFGQTSACFSGRSPNQAVPSANAAGATSGQTPSLRPFQVDDAPRTDIRHVPEARSFAPEPRSSETFPCQISYDTRTVPAGKGPSRWYDAMLGRSNLIGNSAGDPILHSETGTFTLAPNTSVTATLQHDAANDAMPPMPTFNARTSVPAPSVAPSGFGGPPPAHNGGGGYSGGDGPNDNGGAYGGGFGGHGHHGSGFGPGGGGGPPDGPPGGPPGGGGPPDGSGPPDGGLDPPSIRPPGRPSGSDTFQCERCAGTFPTTRQTGNPPGPNDSGFGGPKGDGSLSEAKKAKCKSFRLDPEPEPAQLRRWIVDMKERVANAFAYDPGYALSWVEIPDGTRYEDLLDECKYGMLENECNSAFRECVRSIALNPKALA
ncbi:KCC4 [Symbiodinium sp. CCMP2592]|nr:KCC4 [Symbiodinium sp. CCMP2592]